ncbi:hypothetical protein CBR_g22252 [Chara braunii]|uniref:Uncharacterized protein n=1 Tax=Chara braunii TaxID=69332 RepID=A0A388L2F2_CHABU|nr:hypothetical protein CBR_g22252 [Chara braunii]|eukprot:GBG76504.1 hypothetical protein CBR_g22252 [Chara braunii]
MLRVLSPDIGLSPLLFLFFPSPCARYSILRLESRVMGNHLAWFDNAIWGFNALGMPGRLCSQVVMD